MSADAGKMNCHFWIFAASPLRFLSSHIERCFVLRSARPHFVVAVAVILGTLAIQLYAEDGNGVNAQPENSSYVFVGFVGGFVRHDNAHHGPVFLAKHIRQYSPKGSFVQVYENRHRRAAYKSIVKALDRNHDGVLSAEEKGHAKVILFGQSWGGSAVVMLARELNRSGIPVLLTVQVDSVAKPWQHDDIIPDNVAAAVNFYQPHGIIHGQQIIRAANDSKTQILGNYRFDYKVTPVKCEGWSWVDRRLIPQHMQSDCDPQLWGQVESLVRQRLEPPHENVASLP
jgi:hypothetical protein